MSRRRMRALEEASGSGDDEAAEGSQPSAPMLRSKRAEQPPRASRRGALQLSQSTTAGTGSASSASNALAVLLAGSRAAAAANGATSGRASGAGGSAGGSSKAPLHPRRGSRAVQPLAPAAAAAGSVDASKQQGAAAARGVEQAGAAGGQAELWVELYAPSSEGELVVHKKKVQEVREWLEAQRRSLGQPGVPRLLVVTGPPGCGKSSVLTTLAKSVGFDVSEWRPPNPVQWQEAQYAGIPRRSKLDEFSEFVARSKMPHLSLHSSSGRGSGRFSQQQTAAAAPAPAASHAGVGEAAAGGTAVGATAASTRPHGRLPPSLLPTLVVVDDLPYAAGPEQRQQIAGALGDLAAGARFPVVVIATETSGKAQQERGLSAAAGSFQGMHKDLVAVLEAHHATTISFNPFTPLNIAKALRGILEKERRVLAEPDIQAIAEQSNGDLFNAISTLQFVCTGVAPAGAAAPAARGRGRGTKRKAAGGSSAAGAAGESGIGRESQVGYALRDRTLTLFHALGKLLYNKRQEHGGSVSGSAAAPSQQPGSGSLPLPSQQHHQQRASSSSGERWPGCSSSFWQASAGKAAVPAPTLQLAAWTQRHPMEFDPEAVLAAAGLEAGSVAAFLHENMMHFIDDGAVEDAAGCLDQLSAADCLASARRWGTGDAMMGDDDSPSNTLLDALAASTAARGVCFSNAHPAPRRWLPLKAPTVFAAGKGLATNRAELSRHTAATWALTGGMASLEPAGRLAAELLPGARAIASLCGNPAALQNLQPARWSRFWNGQLYDQGSGGSGRAGWQQEQEGEAAGLAGTGGGRLPADDVIEESEDEDDW